MKKRVLILLSLAISLSAVSQKLKGSDTLLPLNSIRRVGSDSKPVEQSLESYP